MNKLIIFQSAGTVNANFSQQFKVSTGTKKTNHVATRKLVKEGYRRSQSTQRRGGKTGKTTIFPLFLCDLCTLLCG
jgi:hypothetical protein